MGIYMKKFFEQYITYSKYIFKFWVNQISMSVFGIIVSLAATINGNSLVVIGSILFSVGFLCFLLYDMMFMKGLEDSVRNRDAFQPNKWEGLKIGLLSYAPTLLIGLIAIILFACNAATVYTIFKLILIFGVSGTYNGFFWLMTPYISEPIIIILTFVPALAATTLGYYLGLKDKPIRKILGIPVKPPKPPKQKTNK
jgi:hypothetical protein